MNDPVNLSKFRKRKKADEKERTAAQNRVKFGRTKGEKARDRHEAEARARRLDGTRREDEKD